MIVDPVRQRAFSAYGHDFISCTYPDGAIKVWNVDLLPPMQFWCNVPFTADKELLKFREDNAAATIIMRHKQWASDPGYKGLPVGGMEK